MGPGIHVNAPMALVPPAGRYVRTQHKAGSTFAMRGCNCRATVFRWDVCVYLPLLFFVSQIPLSFCTLLTLTFPLLFLLLSHPLESLHLPPPLLLPPPLSFSLRLFASRSLLLFFLAFPPLFLLRQPLQPADGDWMLMEQQLLCPLFECISICPSYIK